MCRYGFVTYKPHYACFDCRKTYKRKLLSDLSKDENAVSVEAKCPECGQLMANMGLDFKAPKKEAIKEWKHIALLFEVGIAFHSCGCSGPGYIPKNATALVEHLSKQRTWYEEQLCYWKKKQAATRKGNRKFSIVEKVEWETPIPKGGSNTTTEAVVYWQTAINKLNSKIAIVRNFKG